MQQRVSHSRIIPTFVIVITGSAALGIAVGASWVAAGGSPLGHLLQSGAPPASVSLQHVGTTVGDPIATRSDAGFAVSLLGDDKKDGARVFTYTVSLPSTGLFADMLGIPRVVNSDASIVLPSQYGLVGTLPDEMRQPGLVDGGASGAIFDDAAIQSGAVLRFGPFFEAAQEGLVITATGAELLAGFETSIAGERFTITLSEVADTPGILAFVFVNENGVAGTVVATHPTTRTTVLVDGQALQDVRGSTNFAKTESLDVHANQSAVVVAGAQIAGQELIEIQIDSIGFVRAGSWDFPLQ